MELSVTDKELVLLDCETQELIERYPLSHIDSVQDINDDPLLNSVLVFSTTQTPEKYAAVHLFQCDKIPVSCQDTSSNLKYSYPCCLLSSLVVYQLCRSLCYSCTEAIRWSKAHCVPQLSVSWLLSHEDNTQSLTWVGHSSEVGSLSLCLSIFIFTPQ